MTAVIEQQTLAPKVFIFKKRRRKNPGTCVASGLQSPLSAFDRFRCRKADMIHNQRF